MMRAALFSETTRCSQGNRPSYAPCLNRYGRRSNKGEYPTCDKEDIYMLSSMGGLAVSF
jgi:hypothetical protein